MRFNINKAARNTKTKLANYKIKKIRLKLNLHLWFKESGLRILSYSENS